MSESPLSSFQIIRRIARQEFAGISRDGRNRAVVLGTLLLLGLALGVGWSEQVRQASERETAMKAQREFWLNLPRMNPHAAAHVGMFVFKPRDPLTFLEPGLAPFTGDSLFLEAHRSNPAQFRPAADQAPARRIGHLSAGLILLVAVPLVIVLLTFESVAGERERGTLRHLLATGVHPAELLLGKVLGIAGVIGLILLPIAAVTAWSVTASTESGPELASRSLLLVGGYAVYLAVHLFLGLAVSAWAKTRRTALLSLLVFWFAACLGLPRLATAAGQGLHPVPPTLSLARGIEQDLARIPEFWERHPRVVERLLRDYNVTSIADVPVSVEGVTLQEGEAEETDVYARHLQSLYGLYGKQGVVYQRFGFLSPAVAMHTLATDLAGSGLLHQMHFLRAAERYRRDFVNQLNAELIHHDQSWNQRRAGQRVAGYAQEKGFWQSIPAFSYRAPALGEIVRHAQSVLIALGVWLAVAVAGVAGAARSLNRRLTHV